MKHYLDYDKTTGSLLFYIDAVNDIPEGAIEITAEEHDLYCSAVGYVMNLESLTVELIPITEVIPAKTEVEVLREQIVSMQEALDFMIMNY
jgi:hypothetical protein